MKSPFFLRHGEPLPTTLDRWNKQDIAISQSQLRFLGQALAREIERVGWDKPRYAVLQERGGRGGMVSDYYEMKEELERATKRAYRAKGFEEYLRWERPAGYHEQKENTGTSNGAKAAG